jgi:hypothetical protein
MYKKWFQLFLKGLVIVYFFCVARRLIKRYSLHVYHTFLYVSVLYD